MLVCSVLHPISFYIYYMMSKRNTDREKKTQSSAENVAAQRKKNFCLLILFPCAVMACIYMYIYLCIQQLTCTFTVAAITDLLTHTNMAYNELRKRNRAKGRNIESERERERLRNRATPNRYQKECRLTAFASVFNLFLLFIVPLETFYSHLVSLFIFYMHILYIRIYISFTACNFFLLAFFAISIVILPISPICLMMLYETLYSQSIQNS